MTPGDPPIISTLSTNPFWSRERCPELEPGVCRTLKPQKPSRSFRLVSGVLLCETRGRRTRSAIIGSNLRGFHKPTAQNLVTFEKQVDNDSTTVRNGAYKQMGIANPSEVVNAIRVPGAS